MFKIISAELKKIVSKPGIYILSVLLAIILVLGVFIYKPTVSQSKQFELQGSTFLEKYDDFAHSSNAGKKAESLTELESAIESINNYTIDSEYTQEEYINSLIAKVDSNYTLYKSCATDNSYQSYITSTKNKKTKLT